MNKCESCMYWNRSNNPGNSSAGICSQKGPGKMEPREAYEFCNFYQDAGGHAVPMPLSSQPPMHITPQTQNATRDYGMNPKNDIIIEVAYQTTTVTKLRIGGVYKMTRPNMYRILDVDEPNQRIRVQEVNQDSQVSPSEWIGLRDWIIQPAESKI